MITFDDHPEFHYTDAKIKERDTVADSTTNTYRIKLTMKTPKDFNVLSGMIVTINVDFSKIMVASSTTIIVPAAAVFSAEDKPADNKERYVWLLDQTSMRVKRSAVSIGKLSNAGIEITDGLVAGNQIITAGVHFLTENQKVRPIIKESGL